MSMAAFGRRWLIEGPMTNLQLLLITCWLLQLLLLLTQSPLTSTEQISEGNDKPKLCGKALTKVLDIVCVNGFNTLLKMKRCSTWQQEDVLAETGTELTALYVDFRQLLKKLELYIDMLETRQPGTIDQRQKRQQQLVHKPAGKQLRQKFRRRRRVRHRHRRVGIVHECCYNGCNYVDIARYCLS